MRCPTGIHLIGFNTSSGPSGHLPLKGKAFGGLFPRNPLYHTRKCLPCAKGGGLKGRRDCRFFPVWYKNKLLKCGQSLSPSGAPFGPLAGGACSTLWLKMCHWHIFFTRRAHYTREPFRIDFSYIIASYEHNIRMMRSDAKQTDKRKTQGKTQQQQQPTNRFPDMPGNCFAVTQAG